MIYGWPGTPTGGWLQWRSCRESTIQRPRLPGKTRDPRGVSPATLFPRKGQHILTGMQWGSTSKNDGGNPSGYVWVFDFRDGRSVNDKGYSISEPRALCVRSSGNDVPHH